MIGLGLIIALMAWPPPEQARAAAAQVAEAEALQLELPADAEGSSFSFESSPGASGGATSKPAATPAAGEGATLGTIVLATLGGVVLIGLIAVSVRDRARPAARRASSSPAPPRPPPPPQSILDEADALAANGRFAEAVHALLMRTIGALSRHMPVDRALTSREIETRARLPEDARAALADLVGAVEVTRFGGRSADAHDYARCVGCFDRIRVALSDGRP